MVARGRGGVIPPLLQQASGQIIKDDVNGFPSISDICSLPRETNELAHEIQRRSKRGIRQVVFQLSILRGGWFLLLETLEPGVKANYGVELKSAQVGGCPNAHAP